MNNDWLQNLKVGDQVIHHQKWGYLSLETISRITKAMVFIRINERYEKNFWRKDGWSVGGGTWDRTYLSQVTQHHLDTIEIQKLSNKAIALKERLSIPSDKDNLIRFIAAIELFVMKKEA